MSATAKAEPLGVSVVLCTCNGESWLDEQLESIERQTLSPDELVVGDDASQDSTFGILQSFASMNEVKFVSSPIGASPDATI